MSKKVEFYFDFLSPYSYLAWTKIKDLNLITDYIPVALANIISHYETKGPGQIEPKRDYLTRDILRYKTLNNIKFKFPPKLPFNSLYALRLCLKGVIGIDQKRLIDLFFTAAWCDHEDLGNSETIERLLTTNGFNKDLLMDKISSKEVKLELRSNIDKALSKGVFGVPTFIVYQNEEENLFWGNDSLNYLEMNLAGNDPLPMEEYKEFLTNFPM